MDAGSLQEDVIPVVVHEMEHQPWQDSGPRYYGCNRKDMLADLDVIEVLLNIDGFLPRGNRVLRFLLGRMVDRLKGDIDARLRRLDSALKHHNFLLQRFAEYELV
jgi:hypothetical protein